MKGRTPDEQKDVVLGVLKDLLPDVATTQFRCVRAGMKAHTCEAHPAHHAAACGCMTLATAHAAHSFPAPLPPQQPLPAHPALSGAQRAVCHQGLWVAGWPHDPRNRRHQGNGDGALVRQRCRTLFLAAAAGCTSWRAAFHRASLASPTCRSAQLRRGPRRASSRSPSAGTLRPVAVWACAPTCARCQHRCALPLVLLLPCFNGLAPSVRTLDALHVAATAMQAFFCDEFGLPLTMKPNFEDLSCQMIFGCAGRVAHWPCLAVLGRVAGCSVAQCTVALSLLLAAVAAAGQSLPRGPCHCRQPPEPKELDEAFKQPCFARQCSMAEAKQTACPKLSTPS